MFKFYAKTQHGENKIRNDDCFLINSFLSQESDYKKQSKHEHFVVAIADGVGSSKFGDIASRKLLENLGMHSNILSHQIILNIIKNTNNELLKSFDGNASTVFSIVYARDDKISIYHLGDTRVYKITNLNNIVQLTNDHTYLQKLIDDGVTNERMKVFHPKKNIILQSLGKEKEIHIDVYNNSFEKGEKLLLTSDGIHDYLTDDMIKNTILSSKNIQNNIDKLIELAKTNSSKDDLSAVLIDYQ